MIIVTGGAGMIGSAFVWKLNEMGIKDILIVDKLRTENKWLNIRKREYYDWIDKDNLKEWLSYKENAHKIEAVIHMGACSATTETDADFLMDNNFGYTKFLWDFCTEKNIKYIYASSAATYGMGELGYNDDVSPEELQKLMPLNKYGYSKKFFDDWAFKQKNQPKQWNGLKFFNVYGPQEYHKGRMASMVFHTYNQYKENGYVKLFKSYKEGFKDYCFKNIDKIKVEILEYGFDYEIEGVKHRQRCRDKDISLMGTTMTFLIGEKLTTGNSGTQNWYFEDNFIYSMDLPKLVEFAKFGKTFIDGVYMAENYFKTLKEHKLIKKDDYLDKIKEFQKKRGVN
nr:MAG TPA: hypothetical protein [Caudoviricetes sp.]